jgi:DNA-binding MarR family transcriptional regulator
MQNKKPMSKKQQAKQLRDFKIKLYASGHPTETVRDLAKRFKVGKSTIAYAINGRKKK